MTYLLSSLTADSRPQLLKSLRRKMEGVEGARRQEKEILSTGCPALDRLLPRGGLARGTLVEWLAEQPGSGAGMLALLAARQASREGRALVVLDRFRRFYPPAAAAWGIDFANLLVVRPSSEKEALWALDQVLRSPSVGAVWAPLEDIDIREFRRLQLAAESGGTLGLLLRPASFRDKPSWAELQLLVRPQAGSGGWRLSVEITRARSGTSGQSVDLEMNDQTGIAQPVIKSHDSHPLYPSTKLARPAASG